MPLSPETALASRGPDATDLEIIAALRRNARITNKNIAAELAVAETTVAQRIKSMADRGVMRVIAQQHIYSNGYEVGCFLHIDTDGRKVEDVGREIAAFDDVISVGHGIGNPDLFVYARAASLPAAHTLAELVGNVRGVAMLEISLCLKVHKYVSALGELLSDQASGRAPVDQSGDRDQAIVDLLTADGRVSNREMARRIGVSEGTIRQRVRRMEQAGRMRLGVVCSPWALDIGTTAIVRIAAQHKPKPSVLRRLVAMQAVNMAVEVSGRSNILLVVNTRDPEALADLCDNRLQSMPGVLNVDVQLMVAAFKHRYELAYIFAPG